MVRTGGKLDATGVRSALEFLLEGDNVDLLARNAKYALRLHAVLADVVDTLFYEDGDAAASCLLCEKVLKGKPKVTAARRYLTALVLGLSSIL